MPRALPPDERTAALHPSVKEVYRDESLWVLDKPAGILSHPNPPARTASNALLRAPYDPERELYRIGVDGAPERHVYLVHRLDLETSGLIVCAFEPEAAAALKEALYHREVEKEYRALLVGSPRREEGEWADSLEKVPRGGRAEVRARPGGRPNASTAFRVLRRYPAAGLTLVALSPRTGRTHQLRVQAASRHLPIAGDDRYGDFTANRFLAERAGLKHMFLHASRLELRHPVRGHLLKFLREPSSRLSGPLERIAGLRVKVPRRPAEPEERQKQQKRGGHTGARRGATGRGARGRDSGDRGSRRRRKRR